MERLKNLLEQRNFPLEKILWEGICYEGQHLLERENPKITILGDNDLRLTWRIWRSFQYGEINKPEIFIVRKETETDLSHLPPEIKTQIIPSFSQDLPKQDLVIAPDFHRGNNAPEFVERAKRVLSEEGFIFGRVPIGSLRTAKTLLELKRAGIHPRKKSLGFNNLLLIFSKEAPIPAAEKSKQHSRVAYTV